MLYTWGDFSNAGKQTVQESLQHSLFGRNVPLRCSSIKVYSSYQAAGPSFLPPWQLYMYATCNGLVIHENG